MDKYKNGKIYTIRYKNDDSLIYVGSTVQPLYKRFSGHKSVSKNPEDENRQLYIKMNETDINDWYIELFEDCICERKEQLNKREGEIIREIGTLNKNIPGKTQQERKDENIDNREQKKILEEINKEEIKDFFEYNEDKIKEYYDDMIEQKKILEEAKKRDRKRRS